MRGYTGRRRPCGGGHGDWIMLSRSQGRPGIARNHEKLDKARRGSPLHVSAGAGPADALLTDF